MTTPLAVHAHGPSDGLPLVLLHAFPLDSRLYDDLLPHLDAPVLAIDLPGFGASPIEAVAGGPPSLAAVAEAILATLDARGVDRFVLAGTSIGGYIAMRLAALAPRRLAGIGLLDTKASPDDDAARRGREETARKAEGEAGTDAVLPILPGLVGRRAAAGPIPQRLAAWAGDADPAGIAYALRAMASRPDSLEDLTALGERGVPALVLRGVEDGAASEDDAVAMAEALRTEVLQIQDAGHLAPVESPEPVGRALADLYARSVA